MRFSFSSGEPGNRRWVRSATRRGSGKFDSTRFFSARVVQLLAVRNPSLMGLTDRHQCDDRLFGQVQRTADTPGRTPVLAVGSKNVRTAETLHWRWSVHDSS